MEPREQGILLSGIVVSLLLSLSVTGAAAPHHPLSDIYPMDVPLDLEGQPIEDSTGTISAADTLNMSGNEIIDYVSDARSNAPTDPAAGQLWFDSGQNILKYYNGTRWVITASADSVSSDLQSALGAGNQAGSYDINMSGQQLLNAHNVRFEDRGSDGASWAIDEGSTGDFQLFQWGGSVALRANTSNDVSVPNGNMDAASFTESGSAILSNDIAGSADQLDGVDLSDISARKRTWAIEDRASGQYFSLGRINTPERPLDAGNSNGVWTITLDHPVDIGNYNGANPTLQMKVSHRNGGLNVNHRVIGTPQYGGDGDRGDIIVTEDADNNHYVYLRFGSYVGGNLEVSYGPNTNTPDLQSISDSSDYTGSVVYRTNASNPSTQLNVGGISTYGTLDMNDNDIRLGPDSYLRQAQGVEFDSQDSNRYRGRIQASGTESQTLDIGFRDTNDDSVEDLMRFRQGGTIDIRNANLDMNGNTITDFEQLDIQRTSNSSANQVLQVTNPELGVSEIRFRSGTNTGSDYGYIRYHDNYIKNGNSETSRLIVGAENDGDSSPYYDDLELRGAHDILFSVNNGSNAGGGEFKFRDGSALRGIMDASGNLDIEGSLTESASLDLAEMMPVQQGTDVQPGDVIGVNDERVTRNTSDAALTAVVSASPGIVLGGPSAVTNLDERAEKQYVPVAFTGQVPVKVEGTAQEGDYLVPSGRNDGTATATDPDTITFDEYRRAIGVVLGRFSIPDNVNDETAEAYRDLVKEAETEPYRIYNTAIGVK